jgi:hypothetical protein
MRRPYEYETRIIMKISTQQRAGETIVEDLTPISSLMYRHVIPNGSIILPL